MISKIKIVSLLLVGFIFIALPNTSAQSSFTYSSRLTVSAEINFGVYTDIQYFGTYIGYNHTSYLIFQFKILQNLANVNSDEILSNRSQYIDFMINNVRSNFMYSPSFFLPVDNAFIYPVIVNQSSNILLSQYYENATIHNYQLNWYKEVKMSQSDYFENGRRDIESGVLLNYQKLEIEYVSTLKNKVTYIYNKTITLHNTTVILGPISSTPSQPVSSIPDFSTSPTIFTTLTNNSGNETTTRQQLYFPIISISSVLVLNTVRKKFREIRRI